MSTAWERGRQLQGQTLWTKTGKAFQVVSVDRQGVIVQPESTGTARTIRRAGVEAAHDLLMLRRRVPELKSGSVIVRPPSRTEEPLRPSASAIWLMSTQVDNCTFLALDFNPGKKTHAKLKLLKITE
jgi:hypothetical protein